MVKSKATDLRVLVVEDEPNWRFGLSTMYCRILRGVSLVKSGLIGPCRECARRDSCLPSCAKPKATAEVLDNLHGNVVAVAGGLDAIRLLRSQPNHFQVLSLDLNLVSQHAASSRTGATGLDVFDEALKSQSLIAVVAITGAARDAELPSILTQREKGRIATLQSELQGKLDGACLFFPKFDEIEYGDADAQIRNIERGLDRKRLMELVRLREAAQLQQESQVLCLNFCLPNDCFDLMRGGPYKDRVPFDRSFFPYLNRIGLWEHELRDESDFDVHADEMLRGLNDFPLILQAERRDAVGRTASDARRGKRRLEGRQQELLIQLVTARIMEHSHFVASGRMHETAHPSTKKNASILRSYLRDELGFRTNPILARDGQYVLEVPVLVFLCSESFLGLELI